AAAMGTVKEVENKLGPVARLHELSQSTEERLTALNALAEHVSHKAKALESQQHAVEHAVVQANRVNEMVWAMDVQIGKLNEGMKQIARADDTLARTEKLAAETNAQLEAAGKLRTESENETTKLKKEATALLDAVRGQVDELAKKTSWQLDSLRQSRQDLDALRKEIQEFYTSHGEAAKLADKLGADRVGLEAFTERISTFAASTPELEAKMDAILGKLKLVEDGTQKATRLHESVAELDAQISRVSARAPFVEKFEGRLNGLNALSADVDRKLEEQLARRNE